MTFEDWFRTHGMPLQACTRYSLEDVSRRAWNAAVAAEQAVAAQPTSCQAIVDNSKQPVTSHTLPPLPEFDEDHYVIGVGNVRTFSATRMKEYAKTCRKAIR